MEGTMHPSGSLADFMDRLEAGPRGAEDALAAIAKCAADQATELDLQQMHLTDDDFAQIAPELQTVADHVTTLNIFMNDLTCLPSSIASLCNLEQLLAGCNPLQNIDAGLLRNTPKLVKLDIGFSETLAELPDAFDQLQNLQVLMAGNGHLASLPSSLFKCTQLEELYLYGNSLKTVPEDLGNLERLRVLNLGRNQLAILPHSIGKCAALETLHVYENCLTALPEGAVNLVALRTLNVLSNEGMPVPPREVRCKADAKAIAAFYATGKVN